ncbi:MAG: zinc-dependent alcohol dehydrogenase [Terriglobia bacterium]
MPEENVHLVGDSISMQEAAILDMEVYAALRKPGIRPNDIVLIEGPGPAGLVASQVARILGARRVLLSGDSEFRLKAGESLGVDRTIHIHKENLIQVVREETQGRGADLVMDCAGTAESFRQALEAVAPGGKVVLYGIYPDPLPQVSILPMILKDLVVYGSVSDRKYWDEVIALVEHGRLNLKRLITHTFPIEEAPKAYDYARDQKDGALKIVLQL